jgi:hypothetical protein
MNQLKVWMQAATAEQQNDLASRAGTSRNYLYHLSADSDKKYARDAEPGLAARIEQAALAMSKETRGKLPKVYRTDLNATCRGCDFASKCLGPIAVRSQFDFLPPDDTEGGTHD